MEDQSMVFCEEKYWLKNFRLCQVISYIRGKQKDIALCSASDIIISKYFFWKYYFLSQDINRIINF